MEDIKRLCSEQLIPEVYRRQGQVGAEQQLHSGTVYFMKYKDGSLRLIIMMDEKNFAEIQYSI